MQLKTIAAGLTLLVTILTVGCNSESEDEKEKPNGVVRLPYMGPVDVINGDTTFHTIPYFAFLNQDSVMITSDDYKGSVYIADFFFTKCPSICPKMTSQMKRLQKMTKGLDIKFLSHTVDPRNDSVVVLKRYAEKNNVDLANWNMVTGVKEEIYELGREGYLLSTQEDEAAPGGFLHSQFFVLIDKKGRIRGLYDGTSTDEVNKLEQELRTIYNE
jgi:protein SCO1/2